MKGILTRYLADDHDRLDGLLRRALRSPGSVDPAPYGEFREGLLRHIAMEEKVMLPAVARLQGGRPADAAARLRLDHGAIVALLVPPPSASVIATLLSILTAHNEFEEKDGGVYELVDMLSGTEAEELLRRLRETPPVAVLPHNERPDVIDSTRRAVERAGYRFIDTATYPALVP